MAFTPDSEVHFLNVPLENDYKNQIYFDEINNQINYFYSKKVHSFYNLTYQRKDSFIRVPLHIDSLSNCNYVMYKNSNYTNKWFYAFITKKEYINDGTTHVFIETDVYQTWFFDVTIKPSFVEREHVIDDTPGLHTISEGLETGDYITDREYSINCFTDCVPCIAVTEFPGGYTPEEGEDIVFNQYSGLYQGCAFITGAEDSLLGMFGGVNNIIEHYVENGKMDAIQSIFMIPYELAQNPRIITSVSWGEGAVTFGIIRNSSEPIGLSNGPENKPSQLNGYTPKNKKLLTYPYCYINLDNNVGGCSQYKYENFNQSTYNFEYQLSLVPGISGKIYPVAYEGIFANYLYSTSLAKLPICSWSGDVYTNWLTQNGVNNALSIGSSALTMIGGLAMMGTGAGALMGGGAAVSGALGIAQTLGQMHQHSFTPPQLEGNLNCGDVNYGMGLHNPKVYEMSIKAEMAKVIDQYFEMFGYKVNTLKIPNLSARPYWNYVKTIDINIDGAIPSEDMKVLKSMFNNGVTLWKNGNLVGDYSQNNHN